MSDVIKETPAFLKSIIQDAAEKNGVPSNLLSALLWAESGFNPKAQSSAGAQGIAQFIPATARGMGVDPWDVNSAIEGAARYLKESYDKFGSWDLALAAYNAGGGAVGKYGGIPPFPETQRYVEKILGKIGGAPTPTPGESYEINLSGKSDYDPFKNDPNRIENPLGAKERLRLDEPFDPIKTLVDVTTKWATPWQFLSPDPVYGDEIQRYMPSYTPAPSSYTVKQGDTLWDIAERYLGSGSRYNELGYRGDPRMLQPGTQIPIPQRSQPQYNTSTNQGPTYNPPPQQSYQPVASGPQQNYTPANANYSSASGGASYAPPPASNNYTPASKTQPKIQFDFTPSLTSGASASMR